MDLVFHPNDRILFNVPQILLTSRGSGRSRPRYLLHMSEHILPAVEHALAFLCVQVEDKVCGVVCIAFLISETKVENSVRKP